MKTETQDTGMKPIVILPPDTMSKEDIAMLRENHLCVVVATNPAAVKFLDPLPAASSRTKLEDAAIALSRKILDKRAYNEATRANFALMYVDLLIKGTPLDPEPSQQEQEKQIFDIAKADELQKLAREEAKAERIAAKNKQPKT